MYHKLRATGCRNLLFDGKIIVNLTRKFPALPEGKSYTFCYLLNAK